MISSVTFGGFAIYSMLTNFTETALMYWDKNSSFAIKVVKNLEIAKTKLSQAQPEHIQAFLNAVLSDGEQQLLLEKQE